jgi:hypothetical protein
MLEPPLGTVLVAGVLFLTNKQRDPEVVKTRSGARAHMAPRELSCGQPLRQKTMPKTEVPNWFLIVRPRDPEE